MVKISGIRQPHSVPSIWVAAVIIPTWIFLGTGSFAGDGNVEKGKNLYRESCRHCHGFAGQGDGDMAEFLNPRPANLTSRSTQSKTDEELLEVILKGRTGTAMAGFDGAFESQQLSDLIAYLRSFSQKPES